MKYIYKYILILFIVGFVNAQNEVTITYLQNDGVMISEGSKKVVIDAIFNFASGWINLPATENNKLINAQEPYNDIDLILITHNHGDHFSTSAVNTHLSNNPNAKLIAPPPVANTFSGSQVVNVNPSFGQSESLTVNDIELEVLNLRHFNAFGNDFSGVQNYGFLIKLGGTNILHLGDVDMAEDNFQNFGLAQRGIDVVLIPTFNSEAHFQTSHKEALMNQIQPDNIIGLHLLSGSIASIRNTVNSFYPGATVFTSPLQTFSLSVTDVANEESLPNNFSLKQNYPNPFNPSTNISFSIPKEGFTRLKIYNIAGEEVSTLINQQLFAGEYNITFNSTGLPSGIYFYRLTTKEYSETKKMILLK